MRNGVDLQRFVPEARNEARERLGIAQNVPVLLSVGHLIERKGHHIAIEAMPMQPPDTVLVIAGSGPDG